MVMLLEPDHVGALGGRAAWQLGPGIIPAGLSGRVFCNSSLRVYGQASRGSHTLRTSVQSTWRRWLYVMRAPFTTRAPGGPRRGRSVGFERFGFGVCVSVCPSSASTAGRPDRDKARAPASAGRLGWDGIPSSRHPAKAKLREGR